jgi:hypothetical protein
MDSLPQPELPRMTGHAPKISLFIRRALGLPLPSHWGWTDGRGHALGGLCFYQPYCLALYCFDFLENIGFVYPTMSTVVGKLLLKSNCVTLLPLLLKETVTLNPLPIFPCNGSVTVTSYCLKVTKSLLVTTKSTSYVAEPLLHYIYRIRKWGLKP